MKKKEMDRIVKEELEHIPKEGLDQNELRMLYTMIRRRDLGKSEDTPKEESLKKAILGVKRNKPNFVPLYDKRYFKI